MNKLNAKERTLILVVCNLLLYYLVYISMLTPILNSRANYKVQADAKQEEYNTNTQIINSREGYINDIATLTEQKNELFQNSFPDAEAENIYVYLVENAKQNSLNVSSVNIEQEIQTVSNEETGEETQTGLKNNIITVSANGPYTGVIKFIEDIENVKKTSLLTSFSVSPGEGGMTATFGYTFLTTNKGEDSNDAIFEHTFGQAKGDTKLFN